MTALPVFGANLTVLRGHVPPVARKLEPLGELPATNELWLAIGLPLRDPAGLKKFLADIYDPASPNYRHYLTPEEFTARFGPTAEEYARVQTFARVNGFRIAATHGNRLILDVRAKPRDIERAFHLRLQRFRHPAEAREFFAPDVEPTVDAALPVADVSGLSDFWRPHPKLVLNKSTVAKAATGSAPGGGFLGDDFRDAYLPGTALTGAGQIVGLVQFDNYYTNDVANYAQLAGGGRSSIPIETVLLGGYNGRQHSGNGEVALDIEMAMAMAPGLQKIIIFTAGPTGLQNDILNAMAASNTVKNLSCSWGWSGGPSTTTDAIFQQMAAQGQSFFNASGDSDAFTTGLFSGNGVDDASKANAPSSSPYITQVGGTTLTTTGMNRAWSAETVWNWGGGTGSSGGISSYYAIPTWQAGISMADNQGSTTNRNIPDVALAADNVYSIYDNGSKGSVGGTSCAAPLWAGLAALANQLADQYGKPSIGLINQTVYTIGKGGGYAEGFHDITTGDNTWSQSPSSFFAVAGYDLCTGWGTPAGPILLDKLAGIGGSLDVISNVMLTASGAAGGPFAPTNFVVTLTNTGSSTFSWAWVGSNAVPWLTVAPGGGTLAAHKSASVNVRLTGAATNLAVGNHAATLTFSNTTSASAVFVACQLQVLPALSIGPADGTYFSGTVGGFAGVAARDFTVVNIGGVPAGWNVVITNDWLLADQTNGMVAALSQTNFTLSLADVVNGFAAGFYTAHVVVNDGSGQLIQVLPVTLNIGQNMVANGGFETGDFTGWALDASLTKVAKIRGLLHSGKHSADLGNPNSLGYLSQMMPTTAGQTYQISLWLRNKRNRRGATPNEFKVQWEGTTLVDLVDMPFGRWTNLQFTVTAANSGSLLNFGFRDDPYYLGLDDVSVRPAATPLVSAVRQAPALAGPKTIQSRAIKENVSTIMARARLYDLKEAISRRIIVMRRLRHSISGEVEFPVFVETNGPAISSTNVMLAGQPGPFGINGIPVAFTGPTLADCNAYPPDTMGAVGPSQFIVAVNGRLRSYNKTTGLADGVLNSSMDAFFSSVMTPVSGTIIGNFTSDPRIRYDRISKRWFVIIIDVPYTSTTPTLQTAANRILFAVSDSDVITPSTIWSFYQFEQDQAPPAGDTGDFADYPTLGIDANALYIGANIFSSSGSFVNTTAFVVQKNSLLSGGPLVVTAFRGLITSSHGGGPPTTAGPYTPQGVDNLDPNAIEGYFIGIDYTSPSTLQLRRVSNPGGTPTLGGNVSISVSTFAAPITVPSLGGSTALDGLDERLLAAHYRNGSLWTAHNVGVNSSGGTSSVTRDGVRWYKIGGIPTGQTPLVQQSGTIYDSSSTNRFYWMGTIMVSGQGHAVAGFSSSASSQYVNASVAGRLASDAPGVFGPVLNYTASSSSYNPPYDRWGDYSYTSLDPNDDMTIWTVQEFVNAVNSYAVQIGKISAPPPASPVSCTPGTVLAGASNVSVMIAGSSANGSGFYDPGSGFSNRLAAAVSGGGITVNSVTYNSPTNIALNLSVASNAVVGARFITVTNPDGQIMASASAILTVATSNQPPSIVTPPSSLTVQCGSNASFYVTAAGTPPLSFQWTFNAAPIAGATNASLSLSGLGISTNSVAVTVTNLYGSVTTNATLTVNDTLPPVIALIGGSPLTNELGTAFVDPGATAGDSCAGPVPVTVTGTVNTSVVGTNLLTYIATDGNGNTNQATRVVFVRDTTPPTILWTFTNLVLVAGTNGTATMPLVTGTNFIQAADLSGTVIIVQSPTNTAALPSGTNAVLLTAKDPSGNTAFSTNAIIVCVSTNAPPGVAAHLMPGGGGLVLQLTGSYGATYVLENATNLVSGGWQPAATNTIGTGGVWQFIDFGVTNIPAQFYRLKLVQ